MGVFDGVRSGLSSVGISTDKIGTMFGRSFEGLLGGTADGVGSGIGDVISKKMARSFGLDPASEALRYFNKVAPGTNPWERLQGAGGGQAAQASIAARKQASDRSIANRVVGTQAETERYKSDKQRELDFHLKNMEFLTSKDIADKQNIANIINQSGQFGGPGAVNTNLQLYKDMVSGLSSQVSIEDAGYVGAERIEKMKMNMDMSRLVTEAQRAATDMDRLLLEWEKFDNEKKFRAFTGELERFRVLTERLGVVSKDGMMGMIQKALADVSDKFGITGVHKDMPHKQWKAFRDKAVKDILYEGRAKEYIKALKQFHESIMSDINQSGLTQDQFRIRNQGILQRR